MPIADTFLDSVIDYERNWKLLDTTLYSLAQNRPLHEELAAINAKVRIIGLAYQTGIQRQINLAGFMGLQGGALRRLAECINVNHAVVDDQLSSLVRFAPPLRPASLNRIIQVHGAFTQLLQPICRNRNIPRSFVSKYMHFHYPLTPIYDNDANGFLALVFGAEPRVNRNGIDDTYRIYARRFFRLFMWLYEHCNNTSVKHVDHFIIYANEVRPQALRAALIQELRQNLR